MLMYHVVIALCILSGGSAEPASCDGDPYEKNDPQKTNGHYGTLSFSGSAPNDGKYPHGTRVTLSCPNGFNVVEPKRSECNDGQWQPKLGRCSNGFDCIIGEEQRMWGYRKIYKPFDPYYEDSNVVKHADWAYFECYNVSVHTFSCLRGQWKPDKPDDNRCGCEELQVKGGCFIYSSPLNKMGRYDPETSATIRCSGNKKPYGAQTSKCNENKWEPSPATCHTPCNAYPFEINNQEQLNGQATLTYTNDPYDDGTYSHNTRVTLSCTSGPVVKGSQESVCDNGRWKPNLGHCPKWCYLDALKKNGFVLGTLRLDDGFSYNHEGRSRVKHTEQAQTVCNKEKFLYVKCNDGEWNPPVSCLKQ